MDDETTSEGARFFIALPIPENTHPVLASAIAEYKKLIGFHVPPPRWHITLVWLGEVNLKASGVHILCKEMPQVFVPTVTFTHIGRGRKADQLWAYVHPTSFLANLRQRLHKRLLMQNIHLRQSETERVFTPHVHVANFQQETTRFFVADLPLTLRFQVKEAQLVKSIPVSGEHRYSIEGLLPFTA
jgi:2'-5' RNA ligase